MDQQRGTVIMANRTPVGPFSRTFSRRDFLSTSLKAGAARFHDGTFAQT